MVMGKKTSSLLIVVLILLADQSLKFWVKTHMMLGQEFSVLGNWFVIHFVENNGMAFGFEFAGNYGKIFLSVFRIAAVVGIGWYLTKLWKKDVPFGLVVSVSLIMAGAIGNILDSAFYGIYSAIATERWLHCSLRVEGIPPFFTDGWLTCCISPSSRGTIRCGSRSGGARNLSFSAPFSTWPIHRLPSESF
jgi:signal peptidase II